MRTQVQFRLDINEIKILKYLAKKFDLSLSSYIRRCLFGPDFFHVDLSNSNNRDFYFCNARNNLNVIERLIEDMYRDYISNIELKFKEEQKQELLEYYRVTNELAEEIEKFFSLIDDRVTECYLSFYKRIDNYLEKDYSDIDYIFKEYEKVEIEKEGYTEFINIRLTETENELLTAICDAQCLSKTEYTRRRCIFPQYEVNGVFIDPKIKDDFNDVGIIINDQAIACHKFYNDYYLGVDFILYEGNNEVLFMYKDIKRTFENILNQIKKRFRRLDIDNDIFYYERTVKLDYKKIMKEIEIKK